MNRIVLVLVLVLVLDHRAHAQPIAVTASEPRDDRNLFGFRIGLGMLPLDHESVTTASIGLGVEHPVWRSWRVFGDYEWLWLVRSHTDTMPGVQGDGQRVLVGVRYTLADKQLFRELAVYVDGELGGGFALVHDDLAGVHALPSALAGLRVGWKLAGHRTSESKELDSELVVRAVAIPGGLGMMGGVGFLWK